MLFLVKLSFKNIFRNHRRTLLTALSICIAVFSVIFGKAFLDGTYNPLRGNMLDLQTGYVRVTGNDYVKKGRIFPVNINVNYSDIESSLENVPELTIARPRIKFVSLIAKGEEEIDGMLLIGVMPEREKDNRMLKGCSIEKGSICISEKFAKMHGIDIGDTLVVITTTVYGYLNGLSLIVKETYNTGISYVANSTIFVNFEDARFLLSYKKNIATEVLLYTDKPSKAPALYRHVSEKLDTSAVDIIYYEGEGSIIRVMKIGIIFSYILAVMIFFLASIAIINTMIMSLYERTKEIGMMKALGLKGGRVFFVFLLESVIIATIGSVAGAVLGGGLTYVLSITGVDFSLAMTNVEFPMDAIIYPVLNWGTVIMGILMGALSAIFSSLFLIKRVSRINPAEILRE